ncbi:hypothetical protein PanWU01x14_297380, partial [Parasponia andersonii]
SVQDYQDQFEKLLTEAGLLEQARQVSCFVERLKDSFGTGIKANKPRTLSSAIGLARLYKARDLTKCKTPQLTP